VSTERGRDVFAFLVVGVALVAMTSCAGLRVARRPTEPQQQHPTISLIEYSDFQCPFAAAGQPIIERVLAVYGQAVKYEYRHHTIGSHPYAIPAARRYEALHDRDPAAADRLRHALFSDQARLNKEGERFLDEVITQLGYDPQLIARESETPSITERLGEQMAEVDAQKLLGTPGYVVAGITLEGPTPFSKFEQVICGELRKARFAAAASHSGPEEPDCWTLVKPDWKRLDELDNGGIAAHAVRLPSTR